MFRNRPGANAFSRFLIGRYGVDPLFRFTSGVVCALFLLSLLTRSAAGGYLSSAFLSLAIVLMIWSYWRVFSRRIEQRRLENDRYMALKYKFCAFFRLKRSCFRQRKDYAFYRCPGCRTLVRVPRGKGRIRITCRHCGYSFEKKT